MRRTLRWSIAYACALSCTAPLTAQSASTVLRVTAQVMPSCAISADAGGATVRVNVSCHQVPRLRVQRGAGVSPELPVIETGRQGAVQFAFPFAGARPLLRSEQASPARPSDVVIVLEF